MEIEELLTKVKIFEKSLTMIQIPHPAELAKIQ